MLRAPGPLALATLNDSIAQQCNYSLPRKDKNGQVKTIEGASIRFAEIIGSPFPIVVELLAVDHAFERDGANAKRISAGDILTLPLQYQFPR